MVQSHFPAKSCIPSTQHYYCNIPNELAESFSTELQDKPQEFINCAIKFSSTEETCKVIYMLKLLGYGTYEGLYTFCIVSEERPEQIHSLYIQCNYVGYCSNISMFASEDYYNKQPRHITYDDVYNKYIEVLRKVQKDDLDL